MTDTPSPSPDLAEAHALVAEMRAALEKHAVIRHLPHSFICELCGSRTPISAKEMVHAPSCLLARTASIAETARLKEAVIEAAFDRKAVYESCYFHESSEYASHEDADRKLEVALDALAAQTSKGSE